MTASKILGLALGLITILVFGDGVRAQNQLSIESVSLPSGGSGELRVEMTNDAPVSGYTLALGFDPSDAGVVGVNLSGTISDSVGAEGFFSQIFPSGGVIVGVFLDQDPPFDGQTIPVGAAQAILNLELMVSASLARGDTTAITFENDTFGSPPVDNEIVTATGSIGVADGLTLTAGTVTAAAGNAALSLTDATIAAGQGDVILLLDNDLGDVFGYTATVDHDPAALALSAIEFTGTDVEPLAPEFVQTNITAQSGSVELIFDADPPFDGPSLPTGVGLSLARFVYECADPMFEPAPPVDTAVAISEGTLTLASSQTATPDTAGAIVTCLPLPLPNTGVSLGTPTAPTDTLSGLPGETIEVAVFVRHPDFSAQGYQIALCFDCRLSVVEAFEIAGTALDGIAEFVLSDVDLDPDDGDGCEFTTGILMDSLPPFDGQVLPPTDTDTWIGTIEATIDSDATAGEALTIEFCEVLDAGGGFVENIVVSDFESIPFADQTGLSITVSDGVAFRRGDCNQDGIRQISDVIALFTSVTDGPVPACPAACDTNGDGNVDLADGVALAEFLFTHGVAPPAPSEFCGAVPGADCDDFGACR